MHLTPISTDSISAVSNNFHFAPRGQLKFEVKSFRCQLKSNDLDANRRSRYTLLQINVNPTGPVLWIL